MIRNERDIKKAIELYLKSRGHLVIPQRTTGIYVGKKGWIPARRKGISDLIVCTKEGRFVALEIKIPGGKRSIEQEQFIDDVNLHNGLAFFAECIDDVMKVGL